MSQRCEKAAFFYLLLRCHDSRFLPLLFHLQWILMVAVNDTFLFPLQVSVLTALQSWHLNSDQAGRKDCRPESAGDWTSFHLSLLLSFPCPDCLFVTLPLEKWHHFFSKTRPALQARLLAHGKRHCASQDFSLSEVQSLQQFLSPLHYLGSSNMLICRFCSSTLYHQIALFSLPWDGSNTVLLVGKVVPLEIFLVAQVSQQSRTPLNICKKKK